MKDYKENGKVIEITLDNGKVVKCSKMWVGKTMKSLNTDLEDVLLMFLEDNDYLVNEDLEELDNYYDDDEISKDGYEKSHRILSAWEYHLKWVLGEV